MFNVNAGMILQCSTKYDVASATNRVVGSTGCSPIFADLGGAFGARDSVFEIATAVLTIFVCLHHFVFAVRGFRFLWLGVWPDNFGGFFLVLHCLVVVTSIVSLVVRFVVRRLVSTDAMLQAVQQGLALEFIDAVALAQVPRVASLLDRMTAALMCCFSRCLCPVPFAVVANNTDDHDFLCRRGVFLQVFERAEVVLLDSGSCHGRWTSSTGAPKSCVRILYLSNRSCGSYTFQIDFVKYPIVNTAFADC